MVRPRQVSDQRILETARSCFLEHGPSVATSVIAGKLGLSEAALFKRFGSKAGLMRASMGLPVGAPAWAVGLETGPDPAFPLRDQLVEIGLKLSTFASRLVPAMHVLRSSGIAPEQLFEGEAPPPVLAHRALSRWLARADELGLARVEAPEEVALAFMGSIEILAFMAHMVGEHFAQMDPETHVRRVVDGLWFGLAPAGETP